MPGELTLSQQTHQYIGTERTFVGFIQNDYAVPVEIPLVEGLSEEHTISHIWWMSMPPLSKRGKTDT